MVNNSELLHTIIVTRSSAQTHLFVVFPVFSLGLSLHGVSQFLGILSFLQMPHSVIIHLKEQRQQSLVSGHKKPPIEASVTVMYYKFKHIIG